MHDGHRDRMKERLLTTNGEGFFEHELLEMLLYFSIPRSDTNPTAHELINTFGSLSGVLNADPNDLKQVKGLGEKSAELIAVVKAILAKYEQSGADSARVLNIADAADYFSRLFGASNTEAVYLMCLDMRFKIISCTKVSEGELDKVPLDIRKITKQALMSGAPHVILAHNHPTGSPRPSMGDVNSTRQLMQTLSALNILLLDHLIISPDGFYSFSAQSLIRESIPAEQIYLKQYADWSK